MPAADMPPKGHSQMLLMQQQMLLLSLPRLGPQPAPSLQLAAA